MERNTIKTKRRNNVVVKVTDNYKLGHALRETSDNDITGYIVEVEGRESFYYKPQVTFLKTYKSQIKEILKSLLVLEKVGFPVDESFKALIELQEEL